jgi:hypothetical protein
VNVSSSAHGRTLGGLVGVGAWGRDPRIIDEIKRFERLCTELAEESRVPLERGARLRSRAFICFVDVARTFVR